MIENMISCIKEEIEWMQDLAQINAVLLFGSQLDGSASGTSDYDICVVAPTTLSSTEQAELLGEIWSHLDANKYDVRLFEELPLYFQMTIINKHEILFCEDIPELYEYFYRFRKMWSAQARRQSLRFEVPID